MPENTTETVAPAEVETEATAPAEAAPEGTETLGDPGKKALDEMKSKWHTARDEAKALRDEMAALRAKAEGREAEFEAERAAKAEADRRYNERVLRAEIKAAAKGRLSDPEDAFRFLDMNEFEVPEDGDLDASTIEDAIARLVESKPYLAVQDGRRFTGTPDAGTRKETGPHQLTRADMSGMTPEQIVAAREAGQFNDLLKNK